MRKCAKGIVLSLVILWSGITGSAEVVDATTSGFTVGSKILIRAAPGEVFAVLAKKVGQWWDPRHSFSGVGRNLYLESRAGGCFCERLEKGGVRHLEVVWVEREKSLRMVGGLGPLQGMGVAGSLTIELKPVDAGTELEWVYRVGGYRPGGLEALATPVDAVLTAQFQRLRNFSERGRANLTE